LGQTLVLPSEFGQITSLSSDCEVLYKQNTTINCDRGEKIYINTGDKFHLNFSLSQDLKNSSGKDSLTRFLLPFDGLGQNLFFYETSSDITAKKDDAGNLYIETKVFKNEEKQIDVNGVIEGGSFMNPTSEDSLLDETDVWNFSSDKISGIYNSFSGDYKVQQVYNYLLRTFEPSTEENFKREKTSELLGRKNLTSIEYSDLATSLLRRLGIKSFILVGDNNGSDDGFFSSWVTYLDPGDGKWKEMDPYFADSSEFGEHLFINHDRITYFKLDGSEDEKLVSELIDEGKTYIESNFYDLDQNLLSKELVYSVQIVTPDVISLNTNAEIALRLTNHSSRLIHFGKITRNKKEIQINKQDENIWVLPSQSYNYDLNGVILAGLLKTISANLSFDYSVNTVSEFKEENISTDVSAVPTFKTFLPYLIGLMFIGAIVFIYFLFRKVRKRRNASKLTEGN